VQIFGFSAIAMTLNGQTRREPTLAENTNTLTAKALKTTVVLDAAQVAGLSVPDGKPRCLVRISVGGRTLTADLNAKSVRKAIATIREAEPETYAVVLQGKLQPDNSIAEAGLTVQLKTKAEAPAPAIAAAAAR
jgi:hypothetical protein